MNNLTKTKANIALALSAKVTLTKAQALYLIESILETIAEQLRKGEAVKIPSFGTFSVNNKLARPGRNPRTGEAVEISARQVVTFRPSAKLKVLLANTKTKICR